MAECENIARVHAYYDGELPGQETRQLEAHLSTCAACAAELAALRSLSMQLRAAAPVPPAELAARIHQGVNRGADALVLRLAWRLTAAAAVIVALCLLRMTLDQDSSTSGGPLLAWEATAVQAADTSAGASTGDDQQLTQWMVDELGGHQAAGGASGGASGRRGETQ